MTLLKNNPLLNKCQKICNFLFHNIQFFQDALKANLITINGFVDCLASIL